MSRVRRAVSLSLDTKAIADKLMGVIGAPTDSFIGPNHLGYTRVGFLEFDPQRAKALLAEAGYEPGTNPLKLNLGVGPERDPRNKEIAELIQASLQAIGAEVELTAITWKVFYGTLREKEGMVYDLIILGFGSQSSDPQHSLYNQFHSVNIPPTAHNFSRLRHAEMDRLLTQQASTFDMDKRLELIKQIQEIIYDDVLAVPMYVRNRDFEMAAYVKGFEPTPHRVVPVPLFERLAGSLTVGRGYRFANPRDLSVAPTDPGGRVHGNTSALRRRGDLDASHTGSGSNLRLYRGGGGFRGMRPG